MRKFVVGFLALALALIGGTGHLMAQKSKGYECIFDKGTVRTFENGVFTSKPAKELRFSIADIDLANQYAALVTPKGTGDLRIVRAIGANHFLEVVTEGYLNVTTIYEIGKPGMREFPAVHSRHLAVFGVPIFTQYQGLCRAK